MPVEHGRLDPQGHFTAREAIRCGVASSAHGQGWRLGPDSGVKPRIGATTMPVPTMPGGDCRRRQSSGPAGPAPVTRQPSRELGRHPRPERFRPDDLAVAAVLHDVHDQLAVVGVGHAQHVAAVREKRALLIRVPALASDPARPFRREAQYRPGDALAREDAVARSQHFVETLIGDIQGARLEDLGVFDGVDREGGQAVPQMAPGVEDQLPRWWLRRCGETSRSVTSSVPRAW